MWRRWSSRSSLRKNYSDAGTLVVAAEIWIVELIAKTGKFRSRGDIRRLIQQGSVTLDSQKITDDKARVTVREPRFSRPASCSSSDFRPLLVDPRRHCAHGGPGTKRIRQKRPGKFVAPP